MYWNLHAVQVSGLQEVLCRLVSAFFKMHNKPLSRAAAILAQPLG